ncbi:uncharacterized protein LOC18443199 [Amborella trichopoda]|uniref:Pentatricopeptide repeat-containing protein n=1 Tax=Amborella trichopoda TaxID=13333 RepID=U5CY62_AMBTC|nr:uncharacterized protein LOC18443199 [Amborella trichopoda]ERN14920.1 hypothetical protein AMTR_s00032p00188550 [Amborella trichopoda]|eukprot:XP_006853453.1 uncharacterized protein LOC18443199 [Amborella trichopoda]
MANSSIESLSTIQSLVQRLCEEPNLAQTMALITKLKHIRCLKKDDFLSLNKLLIVEYFGRRRFKEGMKLFGRLCGEDSKWAPDYSLCEEVIKGCYRWPMGFEALRVVRFMVGNSAIPGPDSWGLVLRCLLREARVREAQELNEAFVGCVHKEGGTLVNGLEKLAKVIDRVLNDWEN